MEIKEISLNLEDKPRGKNGNKNGKNGIREILPKVPKKRVITTSKNWVIKEENLGSLAQLKYVQDILENINTCHIINDTSDDNILKIIENQIHQKLSGYKNQDIKKGLFKEDLFIKYEQVLQKMLECENQCYYCKDFVLVLYENVREPKQWTLERIYNTMGHNSDNVVIACLDCNLRRRTIYHERYLFTKQLQIKKTTESL